jgi:hypothetical protein
MNEGLLLNFIVVDFGDGLMIWNCMLMFENITHGTF